MIIANITDREHYYSLHPKMKQLWDYILTHDLANSPTGRINIDGDRLFVNVDDSEMSPKEERPLEVHRRYIDVQIPLTASETVGWKALADITTPSVAPFNTQHDIAFFAEPAQAYIPVHPGQFYVMFPEDAHAPIIGSGRIKKLIGIFEGDIENGELEIGQSAAYINKVLTAEEAMRSIVAECEERRKVLLAELL